MVCNYRPKGNIPDEFRENVLHVGTTESSSKESISLMTSGLALVYSRHLPPHHVDVFTVHMLRCHNIYRSRHGCADLKLSHELTVYARRCANVSLIHDMSHVTNTSTCHITHCILEIYISRVRTIILNQWMEGSMVGLIWNTDSTLATCLNVRQSWLTYIAPIVTYIHN